jgi:hypothetical protein
MIKSKRKLIPIFSQVRQWMRTQRARHHQEIPICVIAAVEKVKLAHFAETSVLKALDQESSTVSKEEASMEVWAVISMSLMMTPMLS